jgi:hypothetical protein
MTNIYHGIKNNKKQQDQQKLVRTNINTALHIVFELHK